MCVYIWPFNSDKIWLYISHTTIITHFKQIKESGLKCSIEFFSSVGHNYINFFCGQLHSKESRECNWVFNIGEVFKTDIFMSVIK